VVNCRVVFLSQNVEALRYNNGVVPNGTFHVDMITYPLRSRWWMVIDLELEEKP
jgi:hypothetical protein